MKLRARGQSAPRQPGLFSREINEKSNQLERSHLAIGTLIAQAPRARRELTERFVPLLRHGVKDQLL
jgi:hypothetical protein